MVLPGARQESLRFTAEKTLSIRERRAYFWAGKCSRICRRTPDALHVERRLAGMTLSAFSCWRQKVWLRSESNSASANTQPIGVCRRALVTSAGSVAQSFHGAWRGLLGQNQLPLQVDHGQPLQPVPPCALRLAKMLYPADKVTAYRTLRQSRGIDAYRGRTSPPPGHAPHNLIHHAGYVVHVQARQEAVQRGVVRNGFQCQGGTQLRVLAESHLRLAEGPVFIPHQAEHGQQLRLRKHSLAEFAPLRGQHFPADVERQPGKSHQSDFGHASFAKAPEQLQLNAVSAAFCTDVSRMSTEPTGL